MSRGFVDSKKQTTHRPTMHRCLLLLHEHFLVKPTYFSNYATHVEVP